MRDVGKNIKDLRQGRGLTQDELAERLFVSRQTVSNYELGRTRPLC
ncbi:MAG: helix-turn-helix domain-containing protein [Clostridiales bacterium]|nr:helix-turn-helix domain-containing protein [Clostridiales bacterium]